MAAVLHMAEMLNLYTEFSGELMAISLLLAFFV
jgi:hypothetical protein